MSYVNKKTRLFKEAGDVELNRKRSDGRMKTYNSATDARAWCDSTEDRRQHILDLVRQGDGKGLSLGKYIPIEAIIDILLANKNIDIKRLQEEIEALKKFIRENGLKPPPPKSEKAGPAEVTEPVIQKQSARPLGSKNVPEGERSAVGGAAWPGAEGGGGSAAGGGAGPGAEGGKGSAAGGGAGPGAEGGKGSGVGGGAGPGAEGVEGSGVGGGARPGAEGVEGSGVGVDGKKESAGGAGGKGSGIGAGKGKGGTSGTEGKDGEDEKETKVINFDISQTRPGDTSGSTSQFVTDSSDNEDGPDKSAREILKGKTPEEQRQALQQALKEKEAYYKDQEAIAREAVEMLERIKDIVDGGDGKAVQPGATSKSNKGPSGGGADKDTTCQDDIAKLEREIEAMKNTSAPDKILRREVEVLKKYCAQLATIQKENADLKKERDLLKSGAGATVDGSSAVKDKLAKLEEVTQERDRLKAKVQQLEEDLKGGKRPQAIDDDSDLGQRLKNMQGLEDEVRKLRDRSAGDGPDQDKLKQKIAELEKQLENCKCKIKEGDIMKVERDCLKMRCDDLARIQRDYEDLLKRTQGYEALKAECAMYKAKYEQLKDLENECNEMRGKMQRLEDLEKERQILLKEIENCECCMNNQEDEIKRLACHIDCLTDDLDNRQDQMKVKVCTMRAHLERKDCVIAKSEQQLEEVQEQLRGSIEQLSCETTCLRARIEELEDEVVDYQKALGARDDKYKALEVTYKELEVTYKELEVTNKKLEVTYKELEATNKALKESSKDKIESLQENNKALLEKLESEKNVKSKLEEALRKAITSDEHLKQMLKKAKCAIKCISQRLEKHDIIGVGRLEAERENYMKKIKELEEGIGEQPCGAERIAQLEEELMKANALNKCLRDNLEQMKGIIEENENLRKLAAQLQEAAKNQMSQIKTTEESISRKSHEIDDKCDELRERLAQREKMIEKLQKMLKEEQDRNTDAISAIKSISASSDIESAENTKLRAQMNVQQAEIDRLNFSLENQKRECEETINKLREKMEQMIADAARIKRLEEENEDTSTDVDKFKKEGILLRAELEKLRERCGSYEEEIEKLKSQIDKLKKDLEAKENEMERFKKENEVLQSGVGQIKDKHSNCDVEIAKLKDEVAKLKSDLEAKLLDLERLKKEGQVLREDVKDKREKSNTMLDKLKSELAIKGSLEKENKDMKDQINKLQQVAAAKDALEKENKDLKDQLEKVKQELAACRGSLEGKNKDLLDEVTKLKQELADVKGAKNALEKENQDLKNEVNKAKEELAACRSSLEGKNKNLEGDVGKLQADLTDATSAKNALGKENKDLKDELNRAKQELAACKGSLEGKNKDLLDEVNKLKKEVADLNAAKSALEKENNDLKDEVKKAKEELTACKSSLEGKNKDLQGDVGKLQKEVADLNAAKGALEKENKDLKDAVQKAKDELAACRSSLEGKNKDLQGDVAKMQKDLTDLSATKSSLEKENKDLKDELNKLKQELAASKSALDSKTKELQDEVNKLKQELAASKSALDGKTKELQDEVNKLKQELAASKSALDGKTKELQDEVNKLKQELAASKSALEGKTKELQDEVNKLKKEMGDLAASKMALEKDNKTLKDELNKAKQDSSAGKTTGATDLDKENKSLKDEINKLRADSAAKESLDKENKNLKDEMNKLKASGDTLEKENKNLKDEINRLKQELDKANPPKDDAKDKQYAKEKDDLLKQIELQKKEIADLLNKMKGPVVGDDQALAKELQNKNKDMEDLKSTIEGLEKKNRDLEKKISDLESKIRDLENSNKAAHNKNNDLEQKIKDMEGRNKELDDKNKNLENKIMDMQSDAAKGSPDAAILIKELQDKLRQAEARVRELEEAVRIPTQGEPVADDEKSKLIALEEELAKRKKECTDMIASLKEQYDRDVKNLRKENESAIGKLQKKHKENLKQKDNEHDGETGKLKEVLKQKEGSLAQLSGQKEPSIKEPSVKEESKEPSIKQEKRRSLTAKTFEEVCICGKLPMVIPIGPRQPSPAKPCYQMPPQQPPPQQIMEPYPLQLMAPPPSQFMAPPPSQFMAPPQYPPEMFMQQQQLMPSMGMWQGPEPMQSHRVGRAASPTREKMASIKKIVDLENRLMAKQEHTKEKIGLLQDTVNQFKRQLELERQRNNDLINRYTNQSKTVANMKVEMDMVKKENFLDKKRILEMNMALQNLLGGSSGPGGSSELSLIENESLTEANETNAECVCGRLCGGGSCKNVRRGFSPGDVEQLTNALETSLDKIDELEGRIEDNATYMTWQDKEIKRLSFHLGSVASDLRNKEQQMKTRRLGSSSEREELEENIQSMSNCVNLGAVIEEKDQKIADLENEKESLLEELGSYEEYIEEQVDEMRKIAYYIDRLGEENEGRGKSGKNCKCAILDEFRTKLEREQANRKILLEQVNSERKSREKAEDSLSKIMALYQDLSNKNDSLRYQCKRMEHLEGKAQRVKELEEEVRGCRCHMKNQDVKIGSLENNLKGEIDKYEEKLTDYEQKKTDLEATLGSMTAREENLREMLRQARFTIKSITQKLEEYDAEKLESQRDNLVKISELESQLVMAKSTINKLRDNLDKMKGVMDKNIALRTLSAQLHESSNLQVSQLQDVNEDLSNKSQNLAEMCICFKSEISEKDKTFDELRNHLMVLKGQLGQEQKLRQETESVVADVAAAGDSEVAKLNQVIDALNEEKNALKLEVQKLTRSTGMGRLKARVKKLEQENDYLRKEVEKFVEYLEKIMPGYIEPEELAKLRKQLGKLDSEVKRQKEEIEKQKMLRIETVEQLKGKLEEYNTRIQVLLDKNEKLRRGGVARTQTVILLEKKDKGGGEVDYRCLYGLERENKQVPERMGGTGRREDHGEVDPLQAENKRLREEMRRLKQELYVVDPEEVVRQKLTIEKFESENRNLKELMEKLQQENQNLMARSKSDDIDEKRTTEALISTLQMENRNLKESIRKPQEMKQDPNVSLRRSKSEAVIEDRRMGGLIDALRDENRNLKDAVRKLEREKQDLFDSLASSGSKTEGFEGDRRMINTLQDENMHLREEMKQLQRELTHVKDAADKESVEILPRTLNYERDDETVKLKDEIRRLREELAKRAGSTTDPDVQNLKDQIADLLSRARASAEASQKDKEEIRFLSKDNEKLKSVLKNPLKGVPPIRFEGNPEVEKALKPLKSAIESEQMRVIDLEEKWRQCENRGDTLRLRNQELEAVVKELRERTRLPSASKLFVSNIDSIHDNLNKWQNSVNGVIEDMTSQVTAISNQVKDSEAKHEDIKQLLGQVADLKKNLDAVIKHKKVAVSNDFHMKHANEIENQLLEKVEENERLKAQVKNLERILQEIRRNTGARLSTDDDGTPNEELQRRLRESERSSTHLQAELNRLRDQRLALFSADPNLEAQARRIEELEETVKKPRETSPQPSLPKSREPRKVSSERRLESDLEQLLGEWQKNYANDIGKLREEMEEFMMMPERCADHGERICELENELEKARHRVDQLEKDNALLVIENEHSHELPAQNYDEGHPNKEMQEIVDHLKSLQKKNDALKTRTVQLELDNGKLKNDLERMMGKDTKGLEKEMQRLREVEKVAQKCQDKYKFLKKRLMKVEIENRNLKKEYINTLIDKEKLKLQGHEQDRRLREISQLLKKTQEKKNSLTNKIVKLQVENENLKQQIDSILNKELEQRIEKFVDTDDKIRAKSIALQTENDQLRDLLLRVQAKSSDPSVSCGALTLLSKPKDEDLKFQLIQLDLENENLKKQLEEMKAKELQSQEGLGEELVDEVSKLERGVATEEDRARLKVVELQIENEYLKNELRNTDKAAEESTIAEKSIAELEDEFQRLAEANENMKKVTVELELDNEYLRKELERISEIQQNLQGDQTDKNLEKQNHAFKMKIDNLEAENQKLTKKIDEMGEISVSLEAHALQKLLREINKLFREYENIKNMPQSASGSHVNDKPELQERMRTWKEKYDPELINLKKDLDTLTGKDKHNAQKVEAQFRECRDKVRKLELENKNMQIALEIMLKEKGIMSNVKLVKEVEQQLKKHEDHSSGKTMPLAEENMLELETRLKECQKVNQMLRKEKMFLATHVKDETIKELEARLKHQEEQISHMDESHLRTSSQHKINTVKLLSLKEELDAMQEKHDLLKKELENVNAEKQLLHTKLQLQAKEYQNEKEELKAELERLYKVNEVQQKLKTDLEKQVKDMKHSDSSSSMLRSRKVSFVDLSGEFSEVELNKVKAQLRQLQEKYEASQKLVAELEDQLKKCRDINKDLKKRHKKTHGSSADIPEDDDGKDKSKLKDTKDDVSQSDNTTISSHQEQQVDRESDELTQTLHRIAETQAQLLESELFADKLYEENLSLRSDVKRVKELEERLREANTKYRSVKFELQKEKSSTQNRRTERRASELEEQLLDSRTDNEIYKVKLENLRKEIALREGVDEENKSLKDQLNSLTRRLVSSDDENKSLKDEVKRLTQRRDELLLENQNQRKEVNDLVNKIRVLEEELERNHEKNQTLNWTISDLRERLDQAEGGRGDDRDRELEETLLKYQNNNEYLNGQVSKLENEKSGLLVELSAYLEEAQNEIPSEQLGRLRAVVQKYRDQNLDLSVALSDGRMDELEDRIQKCPAENENLVQVTLQLEEEVQFLKRELVRLTTEEKKGQKKPKTVRRRPSDEPKLVEVEREKKDQIVRSQLSDAKTLEEESKKQKIKTVRSRLSQDKKVAKKSEILERELGQQKRKWKNIVSKLTKGYEENLGRLKQRLQTMVPSAARPDNALQQWMIPPSAFTAMPLMWQPMLNYSKYMAPQISEAQVGPHADDNLDHLSSMVDEIQKTLDDSKKVVNENFDTEEEEEELLDYGLYDFSSDAASNAGELNRQFWKQQETKGTIEKLQTDDHQTIKELKDVSQKRTSCSAHRSEMAGPSTARDSDHSRTEFKTVISKHSSLMSHCKMVPSSEKTQGKKSPSASPSTESRQRKSGSKSESLKK